MTETNPPGQPLLQNDCAPKSRLPSRTPFFGSFRLKQTYNLRDVLRSMPGCSPCSVVSAQRTEEEGGGSRQTPGPSPFPDEHGDSGLRSFWAEGSRGARTEDGWPCSLGAKGTLNSEGVISAASFCIWLFCLLQAKQCLPLLPLPSSLLCQTVPRIPICILWRYLIFNPKAS